MKSESLFPPKGERRFGAYFSSSDSELLRGALRGYGGETSLEIGSGNGGTLLELAKRFRIAAGTDLVKPAFRMPVNRGNVDFVLADRASCFRDSAFDLVVFNPPYVPSEGVEDGAVDGGKDGVEVPLTFLEEALRVTKPTGRIVMLLSSHNPVEKFETLCAQRGLEMRLGASKALFYEKLFVYIIRRAEPDSEHSLRRGIGFP